MELRECYEQMGGDYDAVMGRLRQEERVRKFLRLFPADENFQLLTDSLAKEDWPTAFRAAHSMKGVALNLGFAALAQSASELTEVLRPGTPSQDPGPLYDQVKERYERTLAAIGALQEQ